MTTRETARWLTGLREEALCLPGRPALKISGGIGGVRAAAEGSTAFPSPQCLAASFDRDLAFRWGAELAGICRQESVQALLISPFLLEDAFLEQTMARSFLEGLKEAQIGAVICGDAWDAVCLYSRDDALRAIRTDDVSKALQALQNGCDLVLSSEVETMSEAIEQALQDGSLPDSCVNDALERIARFYDVWSPLLEADPDFFIGSSHHFCRRAARESAVLLKNEDVLPLRPGHRIALIGAYAIDPPCRALGPDRVEPLDLDGAYFSARSVAKVAFARGFQEGVDDAALREEAVALAGASERVVLFLGMPDTRPVRAGEALPEEQLRLLKEVCGVCDSVIVLLHAAAPVDLSWIDDVQAVLWMSLAGEAVGGAAVDLLFGAVSPTGCLPFNWPGRPGFSFGWGFSYTTFEYSQPIVEEDALLIAVTNTGRRTAAKTMRLYRKEQGAWRLCDFQKCVIPAGKTVSIHFPLFGDDPQAFRVE